MWLNPGVSEETGCNFQPNGLLSEVGLIRWFRIRAQVLPWDKTVRGPELDLKRWFSFAWFQFLLKMNKQQQQKPYLLTSETGYKGQNYRLFNHSP